MTSCKLCDLSTNCFLWPYAEYYISGLSWPCQACICLRDFEFSLSFVLNINLLLPHLSLPCYPFQYLLTEVPLIYHSNFHRAMLHANIMLIALFSIAQLPDYRVKSLPTIHESVKTQTEWAFMIIQFSHHKKKTACKISLWICWS